MAALVSSSELDPPIYRESKYTRKHANCVALEDPDISVKDIVAYGLFGKGSSCLKAPTTLMFDAYFVAYIFFCR